MLDEKILDLIINQDLKRTNRINKKLIDGLKKQNEYNSEKLRKLTNGGTTEQTKVAWKECLGRAGYNIKKF